MMTEERQAAERPSFGRRLGRAIGTLLRVLLRILLVLVIGILLGVGLYFGAIFVYQQYIVPAQVNTIRVDVLAAQQDQMDERVSGRLDDLQGRVYELEAQRDADKAALAELESRLAVAEATRAAQATAVSEIASIQSDLAEIEQELSGAVAAAETLRADLVALQETVDAEQARAEAFEGDLSEVDAKLEALDAQLADTETALGRLAESLDAYVQDVMVLRGELAGENAPAAVRRDLELVKVMELLTRSRLLLVQNNVGLAEADIATARAALAALPPQPTTYQEAVALAIDRLDAALEGLPLAPVAAADELEGAWQVLLAVLSEGQTVGSAAAEVTPPAEATPEVEETPEATTTPEETVTPEATPTPTPAS
jgi:hypothetical protein